MVGGELADLTLGEAAAWILEITLFAPELQRTGCDPKRPTQTVRPQLLIRQMGVIVTRPPPSWQGCETPVGEFIEEHLGMSKRLASSTRLPISNRVPGTEIAPKMCVA